MTPPETIDGHGPAVLLVHGLGGTSNFYQPQAEVLAE
jgi:3-oxoadipate enol-lactonase